MWISPTRTYVYRNRGYPHRCEQCMQQLEAGQRYERWLWRPEGKRLYVCVRHIDERDCPWEELEAMHSPEPAAAEVYVVQVISSRMVGKVLADGTTIFVPEPYVETITTTDPPDENFDPSDDDEIPF